MKRLAINLAACVAGLVAATLAVVGFVEGTWAAAPDAAQWLTYTVDGTIVVYVTYFVFAAVIAYGARGWLRRRAGHDRDAPRPTPDRR